ncbi:MAG: AbrB/MazE/SpoVT family DNA-binding domain-containing protein [Spirochaetaceae bacterium]|nr:MAG: AbrB/MazE/SpoVT family DNA-binding domain-containing protein [Spirochaetaceae bacterium]
MLAKLTVRNQITIPKEVAARFPGVEYFEVTEEEGRVVLTPLRPSRAEEVREQLKDYGIEPDDVEDALRWARSAHSDGA